jgi:hypothetical protein
MFIVLFTMYFSGGIIPEYILFQGLKITNTVWVLLLPGMISAYNMIILKSFFANIPASIEESAFLDGASTICTLVRIVLPLSKPVLATLALFYMVSRWNSFQDALYYITDATLFPLQLKLNMLINITQSAELTQFEGADLSQLMVRTNVNEIDVARLKIGDGANVRIDPLRSLMVKGRVRRIATSATESAVDRTRVFPVDVVLENVDPRLRPGMSATVTFTLSRADDTPSIPLSAVFTTADSVRYVFAKTATGFSPRAVEIGISDTRRAQVLGGLESNEEVALTRPLVFEGEIPIAGPGGASAVVKARSARPAQPAQAAQGGS